MIRCKVLFALALTLATPAIAQEAIAIKAGRMIPIVGEEQKDVVILIEGGKIKSIGKDVKPAWNARVIDASDKVVMPTYVIAHTSGGLSAGDAENMANVPFLTVQDAVDPASTYFEEALRNGVGTIHVVPGNRTLIGGMGMVVRPFGKTVEDMAVQTKSAMKLSLLASGGPMGGSGSKVAQIRKMRRAFEDVQDYLKDWNRKKEEFAKEKAAGATGDKKEFDEQIDPQKKPMVDLLEGKMKAFLYVPGPAELTEALRMGAAYKFPTTLVLGRDCHKAASALAGYKGIVCLDPDLEFYETEPDSDDEKLVCTTTAMAKAGIAFTISIDENADSPRRFPWWQMATAIRNGMDRKAALEAMTIVPAKVIGMQDQFGSIEEGKVANLQILTGDPLKSTTWVEQVLLEGVVSYERSKDRRLQYVSGKADQPKTETK